MSARDDYVAALVAEAAILKTGVWSPVDGMCGTCRGCPSDYEARTGKQCPQCDGDGFRWPPPCATCGEPMEQKVIPLTDEYEIQGWACPNEHK